ncbi:hypothetical protein ACMA5I_08865 [Paracoccaceae bacterium GXU_MW_L88]
MALIFLLGACSQQSFLPRQYDAAFEPSDLQVTRNAEGYYIVGDEQQISELFHTGRDLCGELGKRSLGLRRMSDVGETPIRGQLVCK